MCQGQTQQSVAINNLMGNAVWSGELNQANTGSGSPNFSDRPVLEIALIVLSMVSYKDPT
jgi:hypothetical protein